MKKRLISILLVAVMICTLLPVSAFAEETVASGTCGANGSNLTWTLDKNGTLTISGTGNMKDYWYAEQPWFSMKSDIKSVVISDGVTYVGEYAFDGCENLESANISDSVTSIGLWAFGLCESLTSVTLPKKLSAVSYCVFYGCSSLKSIDIPDRVTIIDESAFSSCRSLESINIPDSVTFIGKSAFSSCDSLTSVEIPDGVTSISMNTFLYCSNLTDVSIPDSVMSIDESAFEDCYSLKNIFYSGSENSWNEISVKRGNDYLTDAFVHYNAKNFATHYSVETTIVPTCVRKGHNIYCCECGDRFEKDIPAFGHDFVDGVCNRCGRIDGYVTLGETDILVQGWYSSDASTNKFVPEESGYYYFTATGDQPVGSRLENSKGERLDSATSTEDDYSITISAYLVEGNEYNIEVYNYSYQGDYETVINLSVSKSDEPAKCGDNLTWKLVDGVLTIEGTGAMWNGDYFDGQPWYKYKYNNDITTVVLPDGLTSIGSCAFKYCEKLKNIAIPGRVRSIGSDAFKNCISMEAFYVGNGNNAFCSDDNGILYNKNKTTLIAYPAGNDRTSIDIPDSVTILGSYAFYLCSNLTSIEIPDGVTAIDDYAFYHCAGLTNIEIPDSVTYIGLWAFAGCDGLTSLSIPDGVKKLYASTFRDCSNLKSVDIPDSVTSIDASLFEGCKNLTSIDIPDRVTCIDAWAFRDCESLTSVEIPDGVTSIRNYAFEGCKSLASIYIPASVTSIDEYAFNKCNNITNVFFSGSEDDWNSISIETGNNCLTDAFIHFNVSDITTHYTAVITDPTCTEQGYTTYTCECGDSYVEDYVDALGHDYVNGVCTRCGDVVIDITEQPSDVSAKVGEIITFSTSATGNALSYQWQFLGASATEWENSTMTGATTDTLTVKAAADNDGQQYRCVITDADGNTVTSEAATLSIDTEETDELKITEQPEDATVKENSNATFTVAVDGEGLTYQWQFCNAGSTAWKNSGMTGATSATITVKALANRDGQQYRCVITDADGNKVISIATTLSIGEDVNELAITEQPEDATVKENNNATFTVVVEGEGLSYQWQFCNAGSTAWKNSGMTGATSATITVKALANRDGQQYRCVITDADGNKVISVATTLSIGEEAEDLAITEQPEDATVKENSNATFTVAADGEGLTYQWQFCNAGSTAWKNSGMTGATTDTITVKAFANRDGQQYRCVITDASGNKVISIATTLSIGEEADELAITEQPEDATVEVNSNAIFTVVADGEGLSYQWQFCNVGSTAWKNSSMTGATTDTITVKAFANRDGQQYRCVITDADGNKVISIATTLSIGEEADELAITEQPEDATVKENSNAIFTVVADGEGLSYQWQFCNVGSTAWKNSGMTGATTDTITVKAFANRDGQMYRCVITDADGNKVTSEAVTLSIAEKPVHVHSYGDWQTVKEATCTETGEECRYCAGCDEYESRVIPETGHTVVADEAVEATCTSTGLTEGSHCSACGEIITAQETVPMIAHSFVDGRCEYCGISESEISGQSSAIVASGTCEGNTSWELDENGVLKIYPTDSELPGSIPDFQQDTDRPWNDYVKNIKSIEVKSGIKSIGNYAFRLCENATKVTIPDGVTNIGNYAFGACESLADVSIPNTVTKIGYCAFINCSNLKCVALPDSVESVGYGAFRGCKSLSDVTLSNSMTYISESMFIGCSKLKSITIPESVTKIGTLAFKNSGLQTVTLPDGIKTIQASAFLGCKFSSITIPKSVSSIGDKAFSGCSNLESVEFTGSESQWAAITVGSNNDPLQNAEIHFAE